MDDASSRLLEELTRRKLIKAGKGAELWRKAGGSRDGLESWLLSNRQVSKVDLLAAKATIYRVTPVDLETWPMDLAVAQILPQSLALRYSVVALALQGTRLTIAMVEPSDAFARDYVRMR
ncbi:MAG: GspE/PulE/PilB domain-containing protein, partial [Candidatus Xenobia bacterium]